MTARALILACGVLLVAIIVSLLSLGEGETDLRVKVPIVNSERLQPGDPDATILNRPPPPAFHHSGIDDSVEQPASQATEILNSRMHDLLRAYSIILRGDVQDEQFFPESLDSEEVRILSRMKDDFALSGAANTLAETVRYLESSSYSRDVRWLVRNVSREVSATTAFDALLHHIEMTGDPYLFEGLSLGSEVIEAHGSIIESAFVAAGRSRERFGLRSGDMSFICTYALACDSSNLEEFFGLIGTDFVASYYESLVITFNTERTSLGVSAALRLFMSLHRDPNRRIDDLNANRLRTSLVRYLERLAAVPDAITILLESITPDSLDSVGGTGIESAFFRFGRTVPGSIVDKIDFVIGFVGMFDHPDQNDWWPSWGTQAAVGHAFAYERDSSGVSAISDIQTLVTRYLSTDKPMEKVVYLSAINGLSVELRKSDRALAAEMLVDIHRKEFPSPFINTPYYDRVWNSIVGMMISGFDTEVMTARILEISDFLQVSSTVFDESSRGGWCSIWFFQSIISAPATEAYALEPERFHTVSRMIDNLLVKIRIQLPAVIEVVLGLISADSSLHRHSVELLSQIEGLDSSRDKDRLRQALLRLISNGD